MRNIKRFSILDCGSAIGAVAVCIAATPALAAQAAPARPTTPKTQLPPTPVLVSPAPSQEAPTDVQEVIVTGSRIVRNGNDAPVPTTVVTAQEIQQRNPTNIADYVNQLPSIGQGNSPRSTTLFANATGGANQISARGLGVVRTLVLLDGRRVVSSCLLYTSPSPRDS